MMVLNVVNVSSSRPAQAVVQLNLRWPAASQFFLLLLQSMSYFHRLDTVAESEASR